MTLDLKLKEGFSRKAKAKEVKNAYGSSSKAGVAWDIVEQYLPLVKSIVSRMRIYFPEDFEKEDVYSIGITGLISAVKNYNPDKGKHFGSYAKIRIRGTLLDELRRIDWLSREDRNRAKKYDRNVQLLEQELKRLPTDEEICKALKISSRENMKLKELKRSISYIPLDAPSHLGEGQEPLLHEIISDPTELNGREIVESHEVTELLRDCLKELKKTAREVMVMYYLKGLRLGEIALVLKLTESRVCQIHSQALSELRIKLRKKMEQ